ncbi:MAG: deoxynucleoside kinase [Clostridia bacterium]|nr:deoxynucleoside kinase [Clostridia bacterium]
MKGNIIVISGTDGCGKETQTKKLFDYLSQKNFEIKTQSFPNYDSLSAGPIKMYLNGELAENANLIDPYQASVPFSVDRFCTMKKYEPFLKKGGLMLLDRYMESNLIHQACKIDDNKKKQKFVDWLYDFEFNVMKIPAPDMVFFLDMPPEMSMALAKKRQGLKSGEKKDIHEQDANHLINAYKNGMEIAKKSGWNIISCTENGKIKTIEQIHTEIAKTVDNFLLNKKCLKQNNQEK